MLQLMRNHARNWLMKLVLGIIILVFIFYFGSMREKQKAEAIATVNGTQIAYADFKSEYQALLDFYRQKYGERLTSDLIKRMSLKERAFESILNQTIILSKADEMKLEITDEELKASILAYPAFQRDGSFDNDLYRRALRNVRMTPETFEATRRRILKIEKMERLIRSSAKVSEQEAYEVYGLQNRKVNVNFLKIATDSIKVGKDISEETLGAYFKEHSEEFAIPPIATIEYVYFSGEALGKASDITDEEIKDYYETNKQEFTDKDQTKSLSSVKDEIVKKIQMIKGMDKAFEKASETHDSIYQNENFDEYVKALDLKVETAELSRNAPPAGRLAGIQDIGEQVFALQEGELGGVLSDNTGYYLFRLASLKPSRIPELTEVSNDVKESYNRYSTIEAAKKKAEDILSLMKGGEDMLALAQKNGLKLSETGLFLPGPEIPQVGYSPDMQIAILELSAQSPYPDKPFFVDGNYVLIGLKEESSLDEEDWKAKKELVKDSLLRVRGERYFMSWVDGIKDEMTKTGKLRILRNLEDL